MRAEILLTIAGMALATYMTRFGSLALLRRTGIPDWFARWLVHVPTAMLTALILPALLIRRQQLVLSLDNHYLIAGAVAAVVAYRSHNAVLTMGLGMTAMFLLRWLG